MSCGCIGHAHAWRMSQARLAAREGGVFIAFRGWSGIEYRASESRQACSPPPSLFLHPPRSVIPLYQFRPARGRGRTEGGRKDQLYIPSWLTRARSCLAGLTCAPASNLNHSHCGGGGVTKFYFAVVPNEWTTAKMQWYFMIAGKICQRLRPLFHLKGVALLLDAC